ncbi:MAG: glycosyltransferase [Candidatus Omnitrophota bacterium]
MSNYSISIVIPAFNAQKTIAQAIDAARNQDYQRSIEIIVVDDGSTDATAQIATSFAGVKYIHQKNLGPAVARNRGFKESRGDIIFFTDSDCVAQNDWVSRCVAHFSDDKIGVVCGTYGIVNTRNLLAQCVHAEIVFRHRVLLPDFPKAFGSYNFCVRRSVFEGVGGFNKHYRFASGEDNDLSYRILQMGYKIYFERKAVVAHHHPERVMKYLSEQYRHGFWRAKMYFDHPQMSIGDDYTFWKDIVEPPLALLITLLFFINTAFFWANLVYLYLFLAGLSALILIELFYGFMTTKSFFKGAFWTLIMLLRAFVRMAGFSLGFPLFFAKKTFQKN